jgi:2-polyprenyl-3-methyl-5-hydroxy-6-metoxy-1,4-benzoquinol methylase
MSVTVRPIDQYREETDCLECGSDRYTPVTDELPDTDVYGEVEEPFGSMRFAFVRCTACGTVYLRQRVVQSEITRFYATEYHCFKSFDERGLIFKTLSRVLTRSKVRTIEKLFPDSDRRLLDHGCGTGTWLDLLRRSGVNWELIGTEISRTQVEKLTEMGIAGHVCDDTTVAQHVEPGSVGVIHLFHVIEHLPDPIGGLARLAELLKPGGAIFGQTPNIASWDCKLFGRFWSQWHVPRHLVMYTKDQLRRHAEAAGLEVRAIKSSVVGATNWAASIQKWWTLSRGHQYGGLQSGALYPALTVGMIPLTLVQSALSQTSDLDFVFVRGRR